MIKDVIIHRPVSECRRLPEADFWPARGFNLPRMVRLSGLSRSYLYHLSFLILSCALLSQEFSVTYARSGSAVQSILSASSQLWPLARPGGRLRNPPKCAGRFSRRVF
jgi:hypothetical protein